MHWAHAWKNALLDRPSACAAKGCDLRAGQSLSMQSPSTMPRLWGRPRNSEFLQMFSLLALCTRFHCQPAQQGCRGSRTCRAYLATGARVLMWVAIFLSQRPHPPLATHLVLPAHRDQAQRSEAEDGLVSGMGKKNASGAPGVPGPTSLCTLAGAHDVRAFHSLR